MSHIKGIVAAGHEKTAEAARIILQEGGNAFDAALAAMLASCIAEPVLASLGGGGFLLAHSGNNQTILYDFFVQTPRRRPAASEIDLYPIIADFGAAQQEFHIGHGSIATPGMIRGLFSIHEDLCRMPMAAIIEPACRLGREGVRLNGFQHYISTVVAPIINASREAARLHEKAGTPGVTAQENDLMVNNDMPDILEALAMEGADLFYHGDMGERLVKDCRENGGCLRRDDLEKYRVEKREPLSLQYHNTRLFTNPPPSIGGTLIAFALSLLEPEQLGRYEYGGANHIRKLARTMWLTQQLRQEQGVDRNLDDATAKRILSNPFVSRYRRTLDRHASFSRGTTQISIMDSEGNLASITLSNGEGSSYVLPETGIMLNNMLGEEDINPHGFNKWPEDRRIASMMAPTLIFCDDGRAIATGSGGSNRIRSAIMQVLINILDFGFSLDDAVEHARIHYESGHLNLESGPTQETLDALLEEFPRQRIWPEKNLFFGGAHTVMSNPDGQLSGRGDSRRGGVCLKA
jgi:gamma-glutamyltranspeptidase/glutathione hydrolase